MGFNDSSLSQNKVVSTGLAIKAACLDTRKDDNQVHNK